MFNNIVCKNKQLPEPRYRRRLCLHAVPPEHLNDWEYYQDEVPVSACSNPSRLPRPAMRRLLLVLLLLRLPAVEVDNRLNVA